MKKTLLLGLMILLSFLVFADKVPPANWGYTLSNSSPKVGETIEIILKTDIPKGYHIYATDYGDCPPLKALIKFSKNETFELVGGLKSINSHHYEDDVFECEVADFEDKGEFRQKIKILKANPEVKATLEYQMCTADGRCVLFKYKFTVDPINVISSGGSTNSPPVKVDDPRDPAKSDPSADETTPEESNPDEVSDDTAKSIDGDIDNASAQLILDKLEDCCGDQASGGASEFGGVIKAEDVDYASYQRKSESDTAACQEKLFDGQSSKTAPSYWGLFILAFLSGLAALLTPCVFPMIPMTVSFFMKDGSKAKAIRTGIIYGLSIIAIYVVIGTVAAAIAGPAIANWLSTHWIPNVIFFLVFVIFAASFFGAFEITLPSWLVNKADKQADKGGLIGVFFMAFTIVLVSFSCTGPIVGSILVQSAGGAFVEPVIGMFGFSLAFAIPFALFAIFPSWLNNLPKSGGWLNSVKVVLGFLELALGLKFLSVADQTYHWGLLDREIYIGLWIVIFTLMGLYLLGKLKFSHDSDMPFVKVPRLFMAICTFAFVVYLIPGLIGAPLKFLAGYLPPMATHDFNIVQKILNPDDITQGYAGVKPKYNEKLHLPDGLRGYFDYDQGMEVARAIGRPVFLDFTGHGCVNCREMEAKVWSDPRVHKYLDQEYVVISLYADDQTLELLEEDRFYTKDGEYVEMLRDKTNYLQDCFFDENSQPQYALLDNRGELLQPTTAYNLNKEEYIKFLKDGKEEYVKRMKAEKAKP